MHRGVTMMIQALAVFAVVVWLHTACSGGVL